VDFGQVAIQTSVSGIQAFYRAAQMDQAAMEAEVRGQEAGRRAKSASDELDQESRYRGEGSPIPKEVADAIREQVNPQLKRIGKSVDDLKFVVESMEGYGRGTISGSDVVIVDSRVLGDSKLLNEVVSHEIAHLVQKGLLGPYAFTQFLRLEQEAFRSLYSVGFTPAPGAVPQVGAISLQDMNLVSGNYPLEAQAEAFGKGAVRAMLSPAVNPAELFAPLQP
jgi:hypothetical protein